MSNLDETVEEVLRAMESVDAVLANAWDGMREVVAFEFGPETVERLTEEQQTRFTDAMLLAMSCLFPDYGEPAAFKGANDG